MPVQIRVGDAWVATVDPLELTDDRAEAHVFERREDVDEAWTHEVTDDVVTHEVP